ncbi:hypothetical protein ACB092_09G134500 [Castanea dentata]
MRFTAVTILGSQREGLYTATMHGYWQVVMTSFEQELLGSRGFSLIPPSGLHATISANLQLLLPTKSVVAYTRKQSWSTIFEWQAKEKGWYLYAGEYPIGWEKKVKVVNLPTPAKKGLVSRSAKPKSTKRGNDSFETYSDIVPYEGGFPPIGSIVLKSSPPLSACTYSSRCPIASKPKPKPIAPWMPLLLAGPEAVRGKHPHHLRLPPLRGDLSTRRILFPPILFCLTSPSWRFLPLWAHPWRVSSMERT